MSATVKHTEAPWLVEDYSDGGESKFCVVPHTYFGTVAICSKVEDARLIAAAPEMLEALKAARAVLQEDRDEIFDCVTVAGSEATMAEIDRPSVERMDVILREIDAALSKAGGGPMIGFIIIPEAMEQAMKRDLDRLRDSLPEHERDAFEAERDIHRQAIIDHYATYGTYPEIGGVEKAGEQP